MQRYRIRLRNKLRQISYKPRNNKDNLLPKKISDSLDTIDRTIEKEITPLLSDFFK